MKISVMSLCRNEAPMLRFYLRCYETFADEILVWDHRSDDGSRELLKAHPLVKLYDCPWTGINEDASLHHFYSMLATRRGDGFTFATDIDELIIPQGETPIRQWCEEAIARTTPIDIIRTAGFNCFTDFTYNACLPVASDELPFEHRQLWDHHPMGVYSNCYSKPVIVRYGCQPKWTRGRHQLEKCNPVRSEQPVLKLLHYGFRHPVFLRAKNARNLAACTDKSYGWSCREDYAGEHSAAWVEREMKKAVNVLELPMPKVSLEDEKILQ